MPSIGHPARGCQCDAHQRIRAYAAVYHREFARKGLRKTQPKPKPVRMPFESLAKLDMPGDVLARKIEQAIACDLTNSQIMRRLNCSYDHVHAVRLRMERIVRSEAA